MAFFDLLDCVGVVVTSKWSGLRSGTFSEDRYVRCDRNISTVKDCCPAVEGVGVERNIVTAAESHFA